MHLLDFFEGQNKVQNKGGHSVVPSRITVAHFTHVPMPKRLTNLAKVNNSNHSQRAHGVQVGMCIYIYIILYIYTAKKITKHLEIHLS